MYDAPVKLSKKKLIEIIILIAVLVWILLFTVNYFRYTRDETPILAIHYKSPCDDGFVHSYSSLGYTYRKYESTSTNFTEFVPFWMPPKTCNLTHGLPMTHKNYPVPQNPKYQPNYRGLVYFYVSRTNLKGAYKCINTEDACTLATSGFDDYNIKNVDKLEALKEQPNMAMVYEKYGFVDDSLNQQYEKGEQQYVRTIYYYDVTKNVILERFADIKFSGLDKYNYGIGDPNGNYIVRDFESRKWGLVNFKEDGTYEKILDYEFDSIDYNTYTGFYILSKDEKWYVYDLKKDEYIIKEYDGVIYDFWENNNMSYYFKTGVKDKLPTGEDYYAFKIHKLDGGMLLDVPDVAAIVHTKHMIMYWKYDDNTLHFMDYVQNDRVEPMKLYFRELDTEKNHFNPAFTYEFDYQGKFISLRIYEGRELKYGHKSTYVNSSTWK